jgi:large-conductance mechanosensitive channel
MKNILLIIFLSFYLLSCNNPTSSDKAYCADQASTAKTDKAAELIYDSCLEQRTEKSDKGTVGEALKSKESTKGGGWINSGDLPGLIITFLFIAFFYFLAKAPNVKTSQKVIDEEDSRWKKSPAKTKKVKSNFWLYNIWLGKSSLAVTFWLYYVVIFSVGSYLIETYLPIEENKWVFFIITASAIYISVAVWRSATNYKLVKSKKKQTNIWGIAAKIIVILQLLMLSARAVYFVSII